MKLLKELCSLYGPSGDESGIRRWILDYVSNESNQWMSKPVIYAGDDLQDALLLEFGNPRTLILAHMDTVGFTVRYENQLVPIGSPEPRRGTKLIGEDDLGPIECRLDYDQDSRLIYKFGRGIERGTSLVYKPNFRKSGHYVESPFLDNRLGVYAALKVSETLKDGLIAFSCWEEHGGGSVPVILKYAWDRYQIKKVLICDITWITDGIFPGKGVVISMRDANIPRRSIINTIIDIADQGKIKYQLEVEAVGSSDGREVQKSPYPMDWCFIGAAEQNVHSENEKVHMDDIREMIRFYQILMQTL